MISTMKMIANCDIMRGNKYHPRVVAPGDVRHERNVFMPTCNDTTDPLYGYCHCGCGQKTTLAPYSSRNKGLVKGNPRLLIQHHNPRIPLEYRFWSKVRLTANDDLCWEWQFGLNDAGYGSFECYFNGVKIRRAHRMAWVLTHGEIPDGLWVLHSCDNRKCCNPKHLFLGTSDDNIQDKLNKGRQMKGEKQHFHKLTSADVIEIRKRYKSGLSQQLALEYNVSKTTIVNAATRKAWKSVIDRIPDDSKEGE